MKKKNIKDFKKIKKNKFSKCLLKKADLFINKIIDILKMENKWRKLIGKVLT
jgi:hypothetical protein